MHNILHGRINALLVCILLVAALVGGVLAGVRYSHDTIYDYTLTVDSASGESVELQYGVWPALARQDFFASVRDGFIANRAHFVEANLTAMIMRVYRDGEPVLTVPIKSKGREGSWWETPSGLYRAEAKEPKHFSSFGHVYMPWSIPFQGNFFIHGWPYYPDGTPVAEGYSGGCIRLEDMYAEQVYNLIEVGMPILVYEEASASDSFAYTLKPPEIAAASYLAADLDNTFVLLAGETGSVHETVILPKLMTALVASEYQNIEKSVTVTDDMLTGITPLRLATGTPYSLYDLFFPLLLEDSLESARAISAYFGEKRFANLLNIKADAIGMKHTEFADTTGERTGNVTTAEDLFLFLKYLRTNRPFVLAMSAGKTDTRTYGEPVFENIAPLHPFKEHSAFAGGAAEAPPAPVLVADVSNTEAAVMLAFASSTKRASVGGSDLITVLTLPLGEHTRHIACIILDSVDPNADTQAMLEYIERMYR